MQSLHNGRNLNFCWPRDDEFNSSNVMRKSINFSEAHFPRCGRTTYMQHFGDHAIVVHLLDLLYREDCTSAIIRNAEGGDVRASYVYHMIIAIMI